MTPSFGPRLGSGPRPPAGFSLLEFIVALLILTVMMGAVFAQIDLLQKRARAEQSKLDSFQQARNFVDLLARDVHNAGYPNTRVLDPSVFTQSPVVNDPRLAVGLVKVDSGELRLETLDDQGNVLSVVYQLVSTGTACPCLRRSQAFKIPGNPLTQQSLALENGVEHVQNTTLFAAYDGNGNAVALPVDMNSNPAAIAGIKTLDVVLTVRGDLRDAQSGQYPVTTLRSTIRLLQCSSVATGQANSC